MGRRREGFLTQWQWDYIRGKKKIDKSRQRVEDYYISKSYETASRQVEDLMLWSQKNNKGLELPFSWVLKHFNPSPGKPKYGIRKITAYEQTVTCPNPKCKQVFQLRLSVDKKGKRVVGQISHFTPTKKLTLDDLGVKRFTSVRPQDKDVL